MYKILYMTVYSCDVIPLSQARARLSELADEVHDGRELIITKNGESYVALIDAQRLDFYRQLEQEHAQAQFVRDVERALEDVEAGRVMDMRTLARTVRKRRKTRRG